MIIGNEELIKKAKQLINLKKMKWGFTSGDCGCALITDKGNIYLGVSIGTPSQVGFCAEHSAIAAMVTNQEFKIDKIVAVDESGIILPPCGRCRELMYQINEDNLDTEVLVKNDKTVKLSELLPYRWDKDL